MALRGYHRTCVSNAHPDRNKVLRIGKKYKKIKLKSEKFESIEYMGSVDWEIKPATPWNYGLILDRENPEKDISVQKNPVQRFPFSDNVQ